MTKGERIIIAAALAAATLLAWAYVLWLSVHMAMPSAEQPLVVAPSGGMAGMDMGSGGPSGDAMADMDMGGVSGPLAPTLKPWSATDFAFMFAMWSAMMVGMMTPSVAPMVLIYAAAGRRSAASGARLASTGWFVAGYLAVWIAFSAFATFGQWALTGLALLTPMMAAASAGFGGILLVAVGLYQWTPLKDTCLRACQSPLGFLIAHGGFSAEPLGAVRLGIAHGAYCLGCCFALMALLFVGGIMNLLWIAGLTILILLEKMVPAGRLIPRISGTLIGAAGVWLLIRAS